MSDDTEPKWFYGWLCVAVLFGLFVLLGFLVVTGIAEANGRHGGEKPGVINDRPMGVREIEDRSDANWAVKTAKLWTAEDDAACRKYSGPLVSPGIGGRYTACMVERSNTRILYMLRRGCTGFTAIADVCKMEIK